MHFMKMISIWLLITASVYGQSLSPTKGAKLSGEKWFDWNGSDWIIRQFDDYLLDSLGSDTLMYRNTYNSSGVMTGTTTFNRTDYSGYYTLSWYYSFYWDKGGYQSYSYTYAYTSDDVLFNYTYKDVSAGPWGSSQTTQSTDYINGKLSCITDTYTDNFSIFFYEEQTLFTYDEYGRILLEVMRIKYSDWIDKERTVWTYDGSTGTGINEIYKNTVWIFQNKKTRTLNASYKPSFENRNIWSWGYWINSQTDDLYYNANNKIYDTQTKIYNSTTGIYDNYKRHYIYYEIFADPLSPPINFVSSFAEGSVTLSWDAVSGATGYNIYSSIDPYGTFTIDATGTFTDTQWTAPASDMKKFYQVTAVNGGK